MDYFFNKDAVCIVTNMITEIQSAKEYLSQVDGAIGDGDHGINMNKGFTICEQRLQGKVFDMSGALNLLSEVLMMEIGGSMGPLYGTLFEGLAAASERVEKIDKKVFGDMLTLAYKNISAVSDAKVGDKTLMDVLIPATEAYKKELVAGKGFRDCINAMTQAAEAGKESTKDMIAKVGRSSRLGERSKGVLDAGATSCNIIMQSIGHTIKDLLNAN